MRLRTRKWGCALGITLLIAVPVACAVWLGQGLVSPSSAQDMLRTLPVFPGASQSEYTRPDDLDRQVTDGDVAQMVYTVKDQPNAVYAFYNDKLPSRGWIARSSRQQLGVYDKHQSYVSGLRLSDYAPWVQIQEGEMWNILGVMASPVRRNDAQFTEVTVELLVHVNPSYQYLP